MATTNKYTELFELESSTSGVRLPSGTTAQRPSTNLNAETLDITQMIIRLNIMMVVIGFK